MAENPLLDRFYAGQTLGAGRLNRIVDNLNDVRQQTFSITPTELDRDTFVVLEIKTLEFNPTSLTCVYPGMGATGGAEEFTVILPLHFTESSRDIGLASPVTYVYSDINTRTASSPGETAENQTITPPLIVGELIFASPASNGNLLMWADGRYWGVASP